LTASLLTDEEKRRYCAALHQSSRISSEVQKYASVSVGHDYLSFCAYGNASYSTQSATVTHLPGSLRRPVVAQPVLSYGRLRLKREVGRYGARKVASCSCLSGLVARCWVHVTNNTKLLDHASIVNSLVLNCNNYDQNFAAIRSRRNGLDSDEHKTCQDQGQVLSKTLHRANPGNM